MKNPRRIFQGIALVILIGVAVAIWHRGHGNNPGGAYLTARVERGDIEDTVSALGTVQPLEFVDVGTQVTGQLKSLHVKIGNQVRKGELIAEIDPTLFASRAGMTAASLKKARAELAEKRVLQHLAQQTYDRNEGLYASQAASEELVEQSKAALDQVTAQIDALDAQCELFRAELIGDRANLRYTKIFAPMSGTVVSLVAREGQTLVASQQAPVILRIADLNTMTVWAQVSEADVPRIGLHKSVFFSPIGFPTKRWHTDVRQILPTPESVNSVILYDVLFDVPNKEQLLKPLMSVQARFVINKSENTLLVPVAALQSIAKEHKHDRVAEAGGAALKVKAESRKENDGRTFDGPEDLDRPGTQKYTVRVLMGNGEVEERKVVVGMKSRIKAEILSGLVEGEEVILGAPEESGKKNKSKSTAESTKL